MLLQITVKDFSSFQGQCTFNINCYNYLIQVRLQQFWIYMKFHDSSSFSYWWIYSSNNLWKCKLTFIPNIRIDKERTIITFFWWLGSQKCSFKFSIRNSQNLSNVNLAELHQKPIIFFYIVFMVTWYTCSYNFLLKTTKLFLVWGTLVLHSPTISSSGTIVIDSISGEPSS